MRRAFAFSLSVLGVLALCACAPQTPLESSSSVDSTSKPSSSESSLIPSSSEGMGSETAPSSQEESSSESSEPDLPLDLTAENLSLLFKKMKETRRFVFGSSGSNSLTFAPDYLASPIQGIGYIALNSYDSEKTQSEKLLYQCSFTFTGKVNVTTPLLKKTLFDLVGTPYTDFSEFNYLSGLPDASFSKASFFDAKEDGYLFSIDEDLVTALATMCGYGKEAANGSFYRAKISLNKHNAVSFVLQGFNDAFKLVDTAASGSFAAIGTASCEPLEQYLKENPDLPSKSLSLAEISSLSFADDNDVVSLDNESHATLTDGSSGLIAKEEINRTKEAYERFLIDPSTGDKTATLVENEEDGIPSYVGLNGDNEVVREKFEKYYSFDSTFPFIYSLLSSDLKAFREVESGHYHYYGWLHSSLFSSVSSLNGSRGISALDLYVENGSFQKIVFSYPTQTGTNSSGSSFLYDLEIVSSLAEDRPLTPVKPYESKPFSDELAKAFKAFDGNRPFQVVAQDDRTSHFKYTTTYTGDVLLFRTDYFTGAGPKSYTHGYKKVDESSYRRFIVDREGNLLPNGFATTGQVKDEIGFHLSPNVFKKKADGTFVFDSYVLSGAKDGMILGTQKKNFLPSTFAMSLSLGGDVASASYSYSDGLFSSGSETLSFAYDEDVALSGDLAASLESLAEFKEPTSWDDEGSSFMTYLRKYFGDAASEIPYVYDPDLYKLWDISDSTAELEISSNSNTADASAFYERYKEALVKEGFVLQETPPASLPGATVYVKGDISLRIAASLKGGIYFWKTGEYK